MKRQTIKSVTSRDYNNALLNLQELCNKDLNIEYNYTGLLTSMYELAYYYNLLAQEIGVDLHLSFSYTVSHSSPVRICLTKTMNNLKDINAPLRISTLELEGFVSLLYGTYTEIFNEYSDAMTDSNEAISESVDTYNEMVTEYNDLLQQTVDAKNVTNQDLADALKGADETTQDVVQSAEENSTPPEGTIGSGITNTSTSDEQDRGRQAAEDYAREHQAEVKSNELAEAAKAANEEFDKALETYNQAIDDQMAAKEAYDQAVTNQTAAQSAVQGATAATTMASNGTLPSNPGESNIVTTSSGTTTVTMNDDGTYTVTHVNSDGTASTTRTYNDASAFDEGSGTFSPAQQSTISEYTQATQDKAAAQNEYNQSRENTQAALEDYTTKEAQAQAAEEAVAENSIPAATPDELDSGWRNSDAEGDTSADDDWGDWSDIVGEGVE